MAVRIELCPSPRGPGFAILRIIGWAHAPGETTLSIQYNQNQKYLDAEGQWGPEFQHALAGMRQEGGVLVGEVGPLVVDALLATSLVGVMVRLQGAGSKTQAMLLGVGTILGSAARGRGATPQDVGGGLILSEADLQTLASAQTHPEPEPQPQPETPQPQPEPEPAAEPAPEPQPEPQPQPAPPPPSSPVPQARRSLMWLWLLLGTVILLAVLGVLAWKFNLPSLIRARLHPQPAQQQAAGPCDIAVIKDKSQAGELGFVQGCLGSSPSNQDILKVAEAAAAAGRCDAARRLFVHVAQGGDAQAALAYARRFDPQAKVDKQCTGDDPDTAAYWYRIPAEAGNVEAQRRVGMLLLQLHESGVEHDEGLKYLRQAAAAGDAEAKAALEKVNAPP